MNDIDMSMVKVLQRRNADLYDELTDERKQRAALEAENRKLREANDETWQTGQTIAVCARQYLDCSKLSPQMAKDALGIALNNWDALTKKQIDAALAAGK